MHASKSIHYFAKSTHSYIKRGIHSIHQRAPNEPVTGDTADQFMLCKFKVKRKKSIGGVCGVILEIDRVDVLPEQRIRKLSLKGI
jgi:hypothetical protein